jgi:AsmA protein
MANAKMTGFDMGSKMTALAAFTGVSKTADTEIQTFSSDLRVAPEGIRSDNLNLVVTSIGSMTGNGTISADHKLDFKMLAHLGAQSNSSPQAGLAKVASSGGIPFKIQGTTSNPQFIPDVAGIVGGLAGGLGNGITNNGLANGAKSAIPTNTKDLGQALGGLFGNKKKPQ